jgi:ribonuclease HI
VNSKQKPRVIIYTDGGCRGNPGVGGWGVLLIDVPSGRSMSLRGGEKDTTNNRMEIQAAIEGLSVMKRPGQAVEIRSDSKYLIDMCTTWMHSWKRKGWVKKGGEIKNLDLIKQLDLLLAKHIVSWKWVQGHSGEPGNDFVDQLANEAMDDIKSGTSATAEKRYESVPIAIQLPSTD